MTDVEKLREALAEWLDSHGEADVEERLADAAREWLEAAAPVADQAEECCQFACYEDPGCACRGCARPAPAEVTGLDVERLYEAIVDELVVLWGEPSDAVSTQVRPIVARNIAERYYRAEDPE